MKSGEKLFILPGKLYRLTNSRSVYRIVKNKEHEDYDVTHDWQPVFIRAGEVVMIIPGKHYYGAAYNIALWGESLCLIDFRDLGTCEEPF